MSKQKLQIRPLTQWEEMAELQQLQQEIWQNHGDHHISPAILTSVALNGGLVLGAFEGDRMIGGAVAMLGAASLDENRPAMANLKLSTELVMVLPEYRNQGLGSHLMLALYQFAAKRGIRLMTWMYDPLSGPFAHISMRKLGAVVSHFLPSIYPAGSVESGGNTDRLQASWWLTSGRALERLKKNGRTPLTLSQYLEGGTRILNATTLDGRALPVPSDAFIQPQSALGLIEIPENVGAIHEADAALAAGWQEHSRAVFAAVLGQGFVLTDFVREVHQGRPRSFYVCSHEGALRGFDKTFNSN